MDATILPGPGIKARPPRARTDGERHSIQSVDRALFLLETIAEAGGEATLTDLSVRTGLNISTCHHLLATLIQRGFAAKVPGRRLYALGARILYLGHACLQVDLPRRAQPFLEAINAATGETVHLAALQGDQVVTVARREARHAVRVDSGRIGKVDAPHATSLGKAIMAWLPEDEMQRMVAHGMKRFTENTITEFPALIEDLRHVRRNGYSMDREEILPGVICIGAAIRDQAGTVIGAISASTPTMRATEEHLGLMRTEIVAAARTMSALFGAPAAQAAADQPQAAAG
ncbi:MAG: IclR family transcriptional regulator [Pseudolabrys sp.]|nr:IclR family transcriptional regulator [Pseudolabrys sp.]MDP2296957.1 IclR family transcriptional regulator [Pseudolabrys sp.]